MGTSSGLRITVLDVGQGNSAVISSSGESVIIDCAPGIALIEGLSALRISRIQAVFLSHADADHIGGLVNLLANEEIRIEAIFLNPDSRKSTRAWEQLRIAVQDARKRYGLTIKLGLTSEVREHFSDFVVDVLAPPPEVAMAGPGGKDLQGRQLTANAASVVIAIKVNESTLAVFPGDIDHVGLDNMLAEKPDEADILVFPHHGGRPSGGDPKEFARKICTALQPRLVIFSFSRSLRKFPLPAVVTTIKNEFPGAHVLCTQLSEHCSVDPLGNDYEHLHSLYSAGIPSGSCCGGSIEVRYMGEELNLGDVIGPHAKFINSFVATPLCSPKG